MKTTTIGKYLLDQLYTRGVRHIFGVPGDYVLKMDKLIEEHRIQYVNTTRENTAGYMADAYARMKGLGVACITYGVGVNITNAMAQAYVESSPIVVISGAAGASETHHSPHLHHLINSHRKDERDCTQFEIFRNVSIDQALLDDPDTALDAIDRVLYSCLRFQKPVYIEIPRDMVDKEVTWRQPLAPEAPKSDPVALEEALNEIVNILKSSQKPVLWIGHETQRLGLVQDAFKFAEKYCIPITTSLLGKGAINEHSPLFVGVYQGGISNAVVTQFVDDCDLLISLGVLLSDVNTGIFSAKLNHPHSITANAEQVAIDHHRYQEVNFTDIVKALAQSEYNILFRHPYPTANCKKKNVSKPTTQKITSTLLFNTLQNHLQSDHILVADIGDSLFGCTDLIVEQDAFFACAFFASLGFCVPAAISTQLVAPKKRVIALVGDGAFQMTCTELSTAVRYSIDPIIIVLNNHGYGTERPLLEGAFNDIVNWRYAELPKLLGGGKGVRVQTEAEFDKALTYALAHRGEFQLIEIELDKTDFSPAMQRFSTLVKNKDKKTSDKDL